MPIFIFCQIYKSLGCTKICQNTPALPSCFDRFPCILETVFVTKHSVASFNPKASLCSVSNLYSFAFQHGKPVSDATTQPELVHIYYLLQV